MKIWTSGKKGTLAAAASALTGSYVTHGGVISCGGYDQLALLIAYTQGDETQIDFRIQFSDVLDFTTAYERIYANVGGTGVQDCLSTEYKRTTAGNIEVPVSTGRWPYFRVQFKATGGTPTGTFAALYNLTNVER